MTLYMCLELVSVWPSHHLNLTHTLTLSHTCILGLSPNKRDFEGVVPSLENNEES
jgi:hypothetical protein